MAEKIGVQAVWDDAAFQRGLQRYMQAIAQAQGQTSRTASQVSTATSAIGRAWQGVGGVIQSALGFIVGGVIVRGFEEIGRAAVRSAEDVFNAVASWERLGLVTQSLVARELSQGQETTVLQQTRISLSEKERERLEELRDTEQALVADIGAAQARLEEMMRPKVTGAGKTQTVTFEDPRIIAERQQNLAALNKRLEETRAEIASLQAKEGALATVEKVVWTNQMSMADAMAQAGPKAKELLNWMEHLAIISPFSTQDVADAFRLAMVYDFTSDEAQRLTAALVDMASGTGLTGDVLDRITMSLGQIHTIGKVSAREVRELALAGVPIKSILARSLNVTTKELENMLEEGVVPTGDALERVVKWMEESFGGAAERQAKTWVGLRESLSDLKNRVIREFFTPIMEPFRPLVVKFVDLLMSEDTRAKVRRAGERIGVVLKWALEGEWRMALYSLGVPQTVIDSIANFVARWNSGWDDVRKRVENIWKELEPLIAPLWKGIEGGLSGVLGGLPNMVIEKVQLAAAELTKVDNWIKEDKAKGMTLAQVGVDIAGRIIGGLIQAFTEKVGEVSNEVSKWAHQPETQTAAMQAGAQIGVWIAQGIKGLFDEDPRTGQSLVESLIVSVGKAMANMHEAIGDLGSLFLGGLISGIVEVAAGKKAAQDFMNWWMEGEKLVESRQHGTPVGQQITEDIENTIVDPLQALADFLFPVRSKPSTSFEQEIQNLWAKDSERRAQVGSEARQVDALPEYSQSVLQLWQEDSFLRTLTKKELEELERMPQQQAWATLWAWEIQRRNEALKAEYEALQSLPDIGTGGLRGSGKAWGVPAFATGLDRVFTQPTLFQGIVAERGPERVQITPSGSAGFNGPLVGQLIINAPGGNPAAVRQAAEIGVVRGARRLGVAVR